MKKKILLGIGVIVIAVAAFIVITLLRGRGGEEPEGPEPLPVVPAPTTYELEELDSVVAFPVGDSVVVTEEQPPEAEEEPEEEPEGSASGAGSEDAEEESPVTVVVTYHYAELTQAQKRVALYCDLLTAEDFGFVPVDEERMETELPAFEGTIGSVHLVRPIVPAEGEEGAETEESLFSLELQWKPKMVSVTVSQIAGGIVSPPSQSPSYGAVLTLNGAVDYIYRCHPSKLGLSGETMENYQVYALDGAVMVDGIPCLRMNVYSKDERTQTNEIAGQYLLSGDGLRLYSIDADGNIQPLER